MTRADSTLSLFDSRVKTVRLLFTWQPSTGGFPGRKQSLRMVSSSKISASLDIYCPHQAVTGAKCLCCFPPKVLKSTVKIKTEIHHYTLLRDTDTSSSSTHSSPTELTQLSESACLAFFSCSNLIQCESAAHWNLSAADKYWLLGNRSRWLQTILYLYY